LLDIRTSGPDVATPLLTRVLHELDWPDPDREVASTIVFAGTARGLTLVASSSGEVVGALFAQLQQGGRVAWVQWLVVDAAHRRRGIGARLMDALEATEGIERIHGSVDRTDPVARRFWASRGWTRTHERPRRVRMGVELPRVRSRAS
jgi:GNAT superfamily N-acetyltransferase